MDLSSSILAICVVAFTSIAAVWDMRTHRLPNWITVPALLSGIAFHIVRGACDGDSWHAGAWSGLIFTVAGFAVGFLPLLVLWLVGGGGAGDVKLMGAVGAWLGAEMTFYTYILSVLTAGLVSLLLLAVSLVRPAAGLAAAARSKRGAGKHSWRLVPYGLPVALGSWAVLAWKILLHS